jgi:hypothetical protein
MAAAATQMFKNLEKLSKRENADIYLFSGTIQRTNVDRFRTVLCNKNPRKENAILFLTTYGGDPDAAYRLSACLRRCYSRTAAYIFGHCKSAGTLAVVGAHRIVMGDFGELGPLDVQLTKPDEILPTASGLDIFQALSVITNSGFEAFEQYLLNIVTRSSGNISAKTAAEIAREFAVGLYSPLTAQIDPERLGEVQRAINIANAYGARLDTGNLKKGGLEQLVQGYPTHGFVIDIDEAKAIFNKVRVANELERSIAANLPWARRPGSDPVIDDLVRLFTPPPKRTTHAARPKAKRATRPVQTGPVGTAGNVTRLRRDAAGDAPSLAEDDNAVGRSDGRSGRSKGRAGGA